ncbi:hypothetical protein FRC07_003130 [Ceratobasidium sp. 392]|nr:hypothetical protein FRC07_003130 [Ceratobasidium sp. 392]
MTRSSPLTTVSEAVTASQALLNAETKHLIGKYRVEISQIQPHPSQRQLSDAWVDSLHQRFLEVGIDRVAFPIKLILHDSGDLQAVTSDCIAATQKHIPQLPPHVKALVYHGQHRVAACRRMVDPEEHWWFAEVYMPALEHAHPAEFMTLMHMGNEDEHRLLTSDSDRFLALYRLSCMLRDGVITSEVHQVNYDRLVRAVVKDATRYGLTNLVSSQELADSVARALKYPYLSMSFNASTWGKKLVKGRFYKLVACLVDEMVEQCRILQDGYLDVSEKPFALAASSCTWNQLEVGVKKKDHSWKDLPGGASAALARLKQRNPDFTSLLNPSGSDDWTFSHTALMPSVLTSDTVVSRLKVMYDLMQHVVHIAAGPELLEKYIKRLAHTSDEDHPFGIISHVLKEKLGGKPSNFPHKIILLLWQTQDSLLKDLEQAGISSAEGTSREAYKSLLAKSKPWWEFFRMFKMSRLPGLGLTVPKVFSLDACSKDTALLQAVRKKRDADLALQASGSGPVDKVSELSSRGSGSRSPSLVVDEATAEPAVLAVPGLSPPGGQSSPAAATRAPETPQSQNELSAAPKQPNKRKRSQRKDGEQLVVGSPSNAQRQKSNNQEDTAYASDDTQTETQPTTRQLRTHELVRKELRCILDGVDRLTPSDARALQGVLESLVDLQGASYMGRVLDALKDKVPNLIERAKKAKQASELAEQDWSDSELEN